MRNGNTEGQNRKYEIRARDLLRTVLSGYRMVTGVEGDPINKNRPPIAIHNNLIFRILKKK